MSAKDGNNDKEGQNAGDMNRRGFFALAAGAVGSLALSACGSSYSGTGSDITTVGPVGGDVRLALGDYPQLTAPDGSLQISVPGKGTLYVLALGNNAYSVVSPICTHQGCTVNIAGDRLPCPCHGSVFTREGAVVRGPATRPLTRYQAEVAANNDLVIHIS